MNRTAAHRSGIDARQIKSQLLVAAKTAMLLHVPYERTSAIGRDVPEAGLHPLHGKSPAWDLGLSHNGPTVAAERNVQRAKRVTSLGIT
jgi:hypothetical protein